MRFGIGCLLVSTALLVSGCGGSNSGTTTPPTPPTVTSVTPANNATGVAVGTALTATFSQAMDAGTIGASTFTLASAADAAITGTVSYSNSVATFTPSADLAYSTQYTATITTGAEDSTGTALAAGYVWSFTTAAAPAPPTVTSVTPANNTTGVAINAALTATFSQAMNAATISSSTFTVMAQGGATVAGTVTYAAPGSVATFTPTASLAYSTQYTATITTAATDSTGTALAANYIWTFTTVAAPVPTVTAVTPASAATGVAINADLTATFSQPMYAPTVDSATFLLMAAGGATVAGTVTYAASGSIATFTPAANLTYNTQYTATITTGAEDSALAPLAANYVWTFTTGAIPNMATIDFGTADQIIRGFGGSTAWLGQLTTAQATALFSPSSGLGLSILRVRIDPTGSSSKSWVTSNWGQEVSNAQEAVGANPNAIVFASPWTPPASMKTSSTSQPYYSGTSACSPGAGFCGGYLDPSNYSAYAAYLEDFVTYFNANSSFDLYGISMQNEPDYSAEPGENYESCSWTAAQMDTWIAGNASVLTAKLIMPESFDFNQAQAQTALEDPSAESLISIIGGHLYGVSPTPYPLAERDGHDIWMTEHYLTPAGSDPTITDALAAAEEVHNSMVTGSYNAYVWWWIWDDPNDGVNYGLIDSSITSPAPTYYGYALGQFAKFIQPGYYRYNATANPSPNVYVSAYAGTLSGQQHYIIVAINGGASPVSQAFSLENGTVTTLTPYQTSSTGGMVQQSAVTVSNGQFTYTLPAQSISTFVQ